MAGEDHISGILEVLEQSPAINPGSIQNPFPFLGYTAKGKLLTLLKQFIGFNNHQLHGLIGSVKFIQALTSKGKVQDI